MDGKQIDERLLCIGTVADRLAVSKRTLHRLNSAGRMPRPVRVGGCLRWKASEINVWIALGCPARAAFEARREMATDGRI
jgi:prophage regulatory protein